jgi:transcriptional regulator GlxA family with amidase domain
VLVVVPPRLLLLDLAGPIEVLRKANLEQTQIRFEVAYAGPQPDVTSSIGLELANIAPLPARVPAGAIVVVPGSAASVLGEDGSIGDATAAAAEDRIVEWLRGAIRPGHRLVSICSGALLAGRAGLLDGRRCTTHHTCCAELARLAPRAEVVEDRLYVEDGDRLSSAGVTAGIDLMLHIVGGLAGPGCAVTIARYLVVYLRRGGADPQLSPWLEGRNHLHPVVHRAQDALAGDPARAWTLGDLARQAHASPRHLSRLFNAHTGMSVTDYLNRLRIALARDLLGQTRFDMEHVAERAGFASARQFRRVWNRFNVGPPGQARRLDGAAAPG